MSATATPARHPAVNTSFPPLRRACTRCDGAQESVAGGNRMRVYQCSTCSMRVEFDLDAGPDQVEWMADRGTPSKWTRDAAANDAWPPAPGE